METYMKIDVIVNNEPNGSFMGVTSKTIWGDEHRIGVGGAELAILTLCEEWAKIGYEIVLYNNPYTTNDKFEQRPLSAFSPNDNRDVLINFRSPSDKTTVSNGLKVWFSTDQYSVGDYAKFSKFVDKIVCISRFHAMYFKTTYNIDNTIVIDLPVRVDDYKDKKIEKIPNRIIFTSIPDRGLDNLYEIWGNIKARVPDASLVITSDYRLWGAGALNEQHKVKWMKHSIAFLGAIPRAKLIEEELMAQILAYPSNYEELFCISCAEAQVAGAFPITTRIGALETTNMGIIVDGNMQNGVTKKAFADNVARLLEEPKLLLSKQDEVRQKALERFAPDRILAEWDSKIFK